MSKRYRLPKGNQQDTAERLFDAFMTLEDLTEPSEKEPVQRNFTFGELYAYAWNPEESGNAELSHALLDDPGLAMDLHRILKKISPFHLPQIAAASLGDIKRRVGQNCQIRFAASRAEPSQVFVMIELADPEMPPPKRLFVYKADQHCASFPLPPAKEGAIQILEDEDSDLLEYLLDINTEVFLR